jgi:hypothetical protein
MSLWNTARALGLKCSVVPIMPESRFYSEEEGPCHLFEGKFYRFGRGRRVTEYDEEDSWGQKLPEWKVTWLNDNGDASAEAKKFREVQMAYMTVSSQILTTCRWIFHRLALTIL